MRYPQVVVCGFDDWLANQLRDAAAAHRWRLDETRRPAAALDLACAPRPTVLLVQADPAADRPDALQLVADVCARSPDVAVVVVSDAKLSEGEQAAWTATALDLGARYVLFPPLVRTILEDLTVGLMTAAVRRARGTAAAVSPPTALAESEFIDLAEEGHEDE